MSNYFDALLNAAVVATTDHNVPAAIDTTGAHATAVQGNTAAVRGAVAHGAANVAAGNVADAHRSGTTASQWLDTHFPAGAVPGNTSGPSLSTPPGVRILRGTPLRRTDSTTDCVEKKSNGQLYSARMGGPVDRPFAQSFSPPPPFEGPRQTSPARGNSSIAFPTTQPGFPPVPRISKGTALRRTDSTTDVVEKTSNGQYFSVRMGDTIDNPFTQHFPSPPPFEDPTHGKGAGQPAYTVGFSARNGAARRRTDSTTDLIEKNDNGQYDSARKGAVITKRVTQQFLPPPPPFADLTTFPSVPIASTRPPPPVVLPEILSLPPIVIPTNLFAPVPNRGPLGPDKRFYAAINVRAKKARSELKWEDPGMRELRPHAHHITPDDCQALRRWILHRGRCDSNLIKAEALCVGNKNQQVTILNELQEADFAKPPQLRENLVTGAELDAQLEIARLRELQQLAAAQVAFVARVFFPEVPPVPAPRPSPPPPPRSIWSAMAGAVTGLLKRKRGVDEPAVPSAKRARVEQKPKPRSRFVFLRRLSVALPPRPQRGAIAETHPEPLLYNGAAAFPSLYSMSDVAMQTDEPQSLVVAAETRRPPSRTPSLTDASVAGPSRKPSNAPLSRTPSLTDASATSSAASPAESAPTDQQRRVHFAQYPSMGSRPRRRISPPPPHMVGTEDEDEEVEGEHQPTAGNVSSARDTPFGAILTSYDLAVLGLDFGGGDAAADADSTTRYLWSHPHDHATYRDFSVQCVLPPSPDAATGQKRRRGTRAGRQVQRRRALKEAAMATEGDVKKVAGGA